MAEQFLKYGVKSGVPVSVEDVVSGLACECRCPSCGAALVARKECYMEFPIFKFYKELESC